MILQVFTIRDRSADVYDRPFFAVSIGVAIRSFTDEVNRNGADNMMFKHPEDFDLYHLGEYDDSSADFTISDNPVQIAIGKNVSVGYVSPAGK